jgi:hypothetical protein
MIQARTQDFHNAGVVFQHAAHEPNQRGFAGAIWPHETYELAGLRRKVKAAQHRDSIVTEAHVPDVEYLAVRRSIANSRVMRILSP